MKILIVDDNENSQMLLAKYLKNYGECICEDDGKKALGTFAEAHYDKAPFDLVLLDIMMPNIDGQKALKIMRKIERKWQVKPEYAAKIIMATSVNSVDEMSKSLIDGDANEYLVKPINFDELSNFIDGLLDKRIDVQRCDATEPNENAYLLSNSALIE